MLDLIKTEINSETSPEKKLNLLREFLQIVALKAIYDNNGFASIAFLGGTALRIVHRIRRYSEDLDFSVYDLKKYNFDAILEGIQREFAYMGLNVEMKKKSRVVNSCFLNFTNVLQELKLSRHKDEKFAVKFEIDTNPPAGAVLESVDHIKYFGFRMQVYDLASLMAGKINAVMSRRFAKGRDFYDLLWYLIEAIEPNETMMINSFKQSNPVLEINSSNWRALVLRKIREMDFTQIRKDLERFVFDPKELQLIELGSFERLLAS